MTTPTNGDIHPSQVIVRAGFVFAKWQMIPFFKRIILLLKHE
jgi:hypothetical protein